MLKPLIRYVWRAPSLQDGLVKTLATGADHKITLYYNKPSSNLFAQLCDRYGSDKGSLQKTGHVFDWPVHSYGDFYAGLFSHCRFHVRRVFECGIGTTNAALPSNMGPGGRPGASLRVWRDYFPNATVIGVDIDRDILFQEERIKTCYMDQTEPGSIAAVWQEAGGDFDLMVDDGLHRFEAGRCLFEHAIGQLTPHGVYIIEDVKVSDLLKYQQFFAGQEYDVQYVTLYRPGSDLHDNNLVVIRKPHSDSREP